jgi:hypothetical protein
MSRRHPAPSNLTDWPWGLTTTTPMCWLWAAWRGVVAVARIHKPTPRRNQKTLFLMGRPQTSLRTIIAPRNTSSPRY